MREFFVPRDMLLCGSKAAMPTDFSVRGFSAGQGEASAFLSGMVNGEGSGDPYWQYVELYLPMTGENNGITFTDAAKGRVVTRNAPLITQVGTGPQGVTSYAYYTSGSDTTAPQISVPHDSSLNLGSKDFCVEWFYRPTTLPASKNHPRFFDKRGSSNNFEIMLVYYNGVLYFYVSADGTVLYPLINGTAWSPTLNQWHHMRVSRNGSTWRLWVDGQKFWEGSWSGTIFSGTAPFTLMGDGVNAHRGTWSMSHFRLTVGHPRETTDVINVPTLPYLTT